MRILLTGANGFIGSAISAALLEAGHNLVAAVRQPEKFRRRFPSAEAVQLDLNHEVDAATWRQTLFGTDVIINCAGILQSGRGESAERIHAAGPIKLFEVAIAAGVKKIIQISAVSIGATTEYASSKRAADRFVEKQKCAWTIIRPSLVYGETVYGGTALLRGIAATPFILPVIGDGRQLVTPIHVDDLARAVVSCLEPSTCNHQIVTACGPHTMTLADYAQHYRQWLGLLKAPIVHVPEPIIAFAARLGDWFGTGPLKTTSLAVR